MSLTKQIFSLSFSLCFVLFAAFSLSFGQQLQEEESKMTAPKTGAISGRVVTENGQPISHATIFVNAQRGFAQPRTTVTDEGGNFQVNDLEALVYIVNVSAPSYVTAPRDPDTLPPYSRIGDSVTIRMIKGGVITGTLTSPTGEPVVQVGVRALLIRDANGKPPSGVRFPTERVTDDRGIYRLYGLPAGTYLVSTGGRGTYGSITNPFEADAPTYAPSSTRDTAAEIVVNAGEETSGVDIRHRGERGHAISGIVRGPSEPNSINLQLTQIVNGVPQMRAYSFQAHDSNGFAFYGIADGDYYLLAQSALGQEGTVSEPQRVTVKGADVTGIELVVKGLASIKGHLTLETTSEPECKNKRQPLLSETLLLARRNEKNATNDQLVLQSYSFAQRTPDMSGDFLLRSLGPGHFSLNARFFAKYWYLRSITRENVAPQPVRGALTNPQVDIARTGLTLKSGERVDGLRVTLAEGAASLRGAVKLAAGENVAPGLYLHLVPAEKEKAEDVLRFFTGAINADGAFAINNLPPGRYWALARIPDSAPLSDLKLRNSDEGAMRTRLRLAAEAVKTEIEFKPCQNVVDYQLPFKNSSLKN